MYAFVQSGLDEFRISSQRNLCYGNGMLHDLVDNVVDIQGSVCDDYKSPLPQGTL